MPKGKAVKPGSLKGWKLKPSAEAKPGSGKRFAALEKKLAAKGAKDTKALAATLARAKFGTKKMSKRASKGKKK